MKESKNSLYNKLIFRETLNDEQTSRKNGGTPTGVIFSNGIGLFNGTTSKIHYPLNLKAGVYSFRIRFYFHTKSGYNWLFCGDTVNANIGFNNGSTIQTYGAGTRYVNGIASSTINSTDGAYNEFIYSGVTLGNNTVAHIGSYFTGATEYTKCDIELVEIYKGTLTASEVKNLYNNSWNVESTMAGGVNGANLIANGTFESATGWSLGNNWNISGGKLNSVASGVPDFRSYPFTTVINKKYILKFTVSNYVAGNVRVYVGNETLATVNTNGEYSFEFTRATGSNTLYVQAIAAFTGSIDNIQVIELRPAMLLDYSSTNGIIEDRTGRTLTPTLAPVKKIGSKYSASFDGDNSKIDIGSDLIGVKAVTFLARVNPKGVGEASAVWIENARAIFGFFNAGGNKEMYLSSNGSTTAITSDDPVKIGKFSFVAATRTADGTANFYYGDLQNAPVLSGTPNQASGTPVAGVTNACIGNGIAQTKGFNGLIPMLQVVEGILTIDEITQIRSKSRMDII